MTDRSNQNWPTEETYELDIRNTRSNDRVLVCNNRLRDVKTEYKGWPKLDLAIENLIGFVIAAEVKSTPVKP